MTRIAISLPGLRQHGTAVEFAQLAEKLGYESVWQTEGRGGDQFSILTACALATSRIQLGTSISSVFVRSAPTVALAAATVDYYSNGRFILGLGSDHAHQVVGMHGMEYTKPIQRLRETVDIVRILLRDGAVSYSGEVFKISGKYDFTFKPFRPEIPLYLAGVNPKMLGICGELSDGALMVNMAIHQIPGRRENVHDGARRVGKKPEDVTIASMISCLASPDRNEARQQMRRRFASPATILPRYIRLKSEAGFAEEVKAMYDAIAVGEYEKAAALISDEFLDAFSISGTPQECREKMDAFREAGLDLPVLFLAGDRNQAVETMKAVAP